VAEVDKPDEKDIAMRMVVDGKARDVTIRELALSNNLAQESLVRLLVKKKLISPDELMEEMQAVRKERYRPMPGQENAG
jgi:hypothetical protein